MIFFVNGLSAGGRRCELAQTARAPVGEKDIKICTAQVLTKFNLCCLLEARARISADTSAAEKLRASRDKQMLFLRQLLKKIKKNICSTAKRFSRKEIVSLSSNLV
jgi:hypothetical protein